MTGTTYGKVRAYTKSPVASNPSASGITSSSAILKAEIYPNFQQTKYGFEYSTSKAALEEGHGKKVSGASELDASAQITTVSANVNGLDEGTRYYYRGTAENASSENPGSPGKGEPPETAKAGLLWQLAVDDSGIPGQRGDVYVAD
ncbi:MAG TPA: hypothetical protein VGF15_07025 [Solirubrobacteraceae bacterium]